MVQISSQRKLYKGLTYINLRNGGVWTLLGYDLVTRKITVERCAFSEKELAAGRFDKLQIKELAPYSFSTMYRSYDEYHDKANQPVGHGRNKVLPRAALQHLTIEGFNHK